MRVVASPDPEALAREYAARQRREQEERREAARRVQIGARQALLREEAEEDERREQERRERQAEVQAEREREFEAQQERSRVWCAQLEELRERVERARAGAQQGDLDAAIRSEDVALVAEIQRMRGAWETIAARAEAELLAHEQAGGLRTRG